MSPTAGEIAGACEVEREHVYRAVASLRDVDPWRFLNLPTKKEWVIPTDGRDPYEIESVDYPAWVVASIVQILANIGARDGCRIPELRNFSARFRSGEVDLRGLYLNE